MNFNPLAAMSGRITIAEVEEIVEPGELDPGQIHTPGSSCSEWCSRPTARSESRNGRCR